MKLKKLMDMQPDLISLRDQLIILGRVSSRQLPQARVRKLGLAVAIYWLTLLLNIAFQRERLLEHEAKVENVQDSVKKLVSLE